MGSILCKEGAVPASVSGQNNTLYGENQFIQPVSQQGHSEASNTIFGTERFNSSYCLVGQNHFSNSRISTNLDGLMTSPPGNRRLGSPQNDPELNFETLSQLDDIQDLLKSVGIELSHEDILLAANALVPRRNHDRSLQAITLETDYFADNFFNDTQLTDTDVKMGLLQNSRLANTSALLSLMNNCNSNDSHANALFCNNANLDNVQMHKSNSTGLNTSFALIESTSNSDASNEAIDVQNIKAAATHIKLTPGSSVNNILAKKELVLRDDTDKNGTSHYENIQGQSIKIHNHGGSLTVSLGDSCKDQDVTIINKRLSDQVITATGDCSITLEDSSPSESPSTSPSVSTSFTPAPSDATPTEMPVKNPTKKPIPEATPSPTEVTSSSSRVKPKLLLAATLLASLWTLTRAQP